MVVFLAHLLQQHLSPCKRLILLRFEYILSHESRYPALRTALLLVRFIEDDGLKMVFPQEIYPKRNIPVVFPWGLTLPVWGFHNYMIDPEALPQIIGETIQVRCCCGTHSRHVDAQFPRKPVLILQAEADFKQKRLINSKYVVWRPLDGGFPAARVLFLLNNLWQY